MLTIPKYPSSFFQLMILFLFATHASADITPQQLAQLQSQMNQSIKTIEMLGSDLKINSQKLEVMQDKLASSNRTAYTSAGAPRTANGHGR